MAALADRHERGGYVFSETNRLITEVLKERKRDADELKSGID